MASILNVQGLTKRYHGRTVVDALDFEVRQGEVFGFLGPNGTGKTTTISMILGLTKPDAGQVEILGHSITRGDKAGLQRVGAIVEYPAFYPYLTARDNLYVMAALHGGIPRYRYDEVLKMVDLQSRQYDKYHTFSLGMKQRLGLASALLHQPDLLILDEPANGLDPAGIVETRALILRLAREGQTILLCSHLLAEVQQVCDRVLILANGRAVVQGEVTMLLQQNRQTFLRVSDSTRAEPLLRSIPWIKNLEHNRDAFLLTMDDEHTLELGVILTQHNIPVLEMHRQERNLEQFFLTMTDASHRKSI